jgi:hypothetical protein
MSIAVEVEATAPLESFAMITSAFEPYGLLVTEILQHAVSTDRVLRAKVAARRMRNQLLNAIYSRLPRGTEQGERGREWIKHTLSR